MSQSQQPDEASVNITDHETAAESAVAVLETVITGLPPTVRKNAASAFTRICTALIEIPATILDGKVAEKRAEADARVLITKTAADQIVAQMQVDPSFALEASQKHAAKIIRQQVNKNKVAAYAAEELKARVDPTLDADKEISEDFLNAFEDEAEKMSSENMQRLFGKILANEINKPASFSIKTIKLMSQLDNSAATLFVRLCSLSISLMSTDVGVFEARVPSIGRHTGSNGLGEFGMNFSSLNILEEYGLINSQYETSNDYIKCTWAPPQPVLTMHHNKKIYGLEFEKIDGQPPATFKIEGVSLSKSGCELLPIVEQEEVPEFTAALRAYLVTQNVKLVELKHIENNKLTRAS